MKIKLDERDIKLFRRIAKKTNSTIEIDNQDYIKWEDVISAIEDLEGKFDEVTNKFQDFVNDVDDNFKRVSVSEQYDISDRDFI